MSKHKRTITRRHFVQRAAATALTLPALSAASAQPAAKKATPPSNRITLGFIGTGNQGLNDVRGFLGDSRVQIVAVCDVNKESPGYWSGGVAGREPAKRVIEKHYADARKAGKYKGCDTYNDFRDLLAR